MNFTSQTKNCRHATATKHTHTQSRTNTAFQRASQTLVDLTLIVHIPTLEVVVRLPWQASCVCVCLHMRLPCTCIVLIRQPQDVCVRALAIINHIAPPPVFCTLVQTSPRAGPLIRRRTTSSSSSSSSHLHRSRCLFLPSTPRDEM